MNRKGFIGDAGFVIAIIIVLALTIIIGAKVFNDYNDNIQSSEVITSDAKNMTDTLNTRYTSLWDGIFMFVFGMLAIALILSVASLGTRPEFFFITIIVAMFFIGAAAVVSNVYENFTGGDLATVASGFSFMNLVLSHLVDMALFLIVLLIGGLYVKARGLI